MPPCPFPAVIHLDHTGHFKTKFPMRIKDLAFLQLLIDENLPRIQEEERQAKAERKRQRAAQEAPQAEGELLPAPQVADGPDA